MSEEEKDIEYLEKYINWETYGERSLEKAIETILRLYKAEKEKYKQLSIEAQATAFDESNKDTESLCRVLLKQGEITLENGEYKRKDFDWEENMCMLGLMKKREKMFYIQDNECLDEYTKQLETQLEEYQELKQIFRKHNITNETMYDGFCRLEKRLEAEKEKNIKAGELLGKRINMCNQFQIELDKQKEKNKELEETLKCTQNSWYEDTKELHAEKEENKNLELCLKAEEKRAEGLENDIKSLLNIEPNDNFIAKSQIKAKIKELQKAISKEEAETCGRCITIDKWRAIEVLQKLLEEKVEVE